MTLIPHLFTFVAFYVTNKNALCSTAFVLKEAEVLLESNYLIVVTLSPTHARFRTAAFDMFYSLVFSAFAFLSRVFDHVDLFEAGMLVAVSSLNTRFRAFNNFKDIGPSPYSTFMTTNWTFLDIEFD